MTGVKDALKILSTLEKRGYEIKICSKDYYTKKEEIKKQILHATGPNSEVVDTLGDNHLKCVMVESEKWISSFYLKLLFTLSGLNLSIKKNNNGPYCADISFKDKEIYLGDGFIMPKVLLEEFREIGKTLGYRIKE